MLHFHYVGHFDPRDYLDFSMGHGRPKVKKAISREATEHALATFGRNVAEYVSYDESGYVVCAAAQASHQMWDEMYQFAVALAEREHAVVMNEPPGWLITYPEDARLAQEKFWAECAKSPPGEK